MSDNCTDNRKFVIFDLDGTLIDSYECVFRCMNKALLELGREILKEDVPIEIGELFNIVFSRYPDVPKNEFKKLFDKYHFIDTQGIAIINYSVFELRYNHENNLITVILTNKLQTIAEKIVKQLNLTPLCNYIIGRKGTSNFKSDIPKVVKVIRAIGLDLINCDLYYGDSNEDKYIADAFNIKFINVKESIFYI